ncbi:MAG: lipid II flippase MurJ [Acidimicrobiales bacterium]|nr:lipid II flippase MurJ [Acidimicrobiales bacterium]
MIGVITRPLTRGSDGEGDRSRDQQNLTRATLAVSSLNLVSRLTGLGRVIAMSAALGATALGDTYQAANLTSNILFELLAGGVLSAALVPTFVELIDRGRRGEAARLAGALLGVALALLGVVVATALLLAPRLMGVLTTGVADGDLRAEQVELGTFLLWFFLPQVLLYAVGAVSTALLHADRRFVAAAVAPVFNNLMVIAAMVMFWAMRDGPPAFDLSMAEKLVLASGATLGVLAMTVVPLVAVWRSGLALTPRWAPRHPQIRPLAAKGVWAAGHLGLAQLFALVTLIVANEVVGGVVAYQVAFTFFLLPYALLANPLTTTLFPRLSASAAAGRSDQLAIDLTWGLRMLAFVLIPASFVLAALTRPLLELVRLGNLDGRGADLVAAATAAYLAGLLGYATFFLVTRAFYALGDTRTPTLVNLATISVGVIALIAGGAMFDATPLLVFLGLTHAAVVTAGSLVLLTGMGRRVGTIALGPALARDLILGAVAGLAAWTVVELIGHDGRLAAALAVGLAGIAAVAVYVAAQAVLGAPELSRLRSAEGGDR